MAIELANRIKQLPPYLFAKIDELKQAAIKQGADIIDLGVGDPDLPTPPHIVSELQAAVTNPSYHQYPSYRGMAEFRQAGADYYKKRWDVTVDSDKETLGLIGSKEGIAHFPFAFVNPGDLVIVPDPGYPVYATATRFAGGEVYSVPLLRENNFLPDLDAIPAKVANAAKIIWVNYPNNPTAVLATADFYKRLIAWADKYDIIIASDNAYADVYYDEANPPISLLSQPGAKERSIEFYSLSKTFNMTGWRVAFAVGNADLIHGLGKVKTNVDSGCFEVVQKAAIAALSGSLDCVADLRKTYKKRRDLLCGNLTQAGFDVLTPQATFYTLVANPKGYTSMEFAGKLLKEAHIVGTPATGFGPSGEGYVRLTLCAKEARLEEAAARIKALNL